VHMRVVVCFEVKEQALTCFAQFKPRDRALGVRWDRMSFDVWVEQARNVHSHLAGSCCLDGIVLLLFLSRCVDVVWK